eukprot:TRINITY_DN25465_c0_g1_i1.p1 TRINITY_DN25465_c0_g1~~TRINITY_DN25465_c0_g1_i1.p1  ORF type:complete len:718 (-),score=120.66 TRINITY_DN25465_c0_g1_i1:423-2576(-)
MEKFHVSAEIRQYCESVVLTNAAGIEVSRLLGSPSVLTLGDLRGAIGAATGRAADAIQLVCYASVVLVGPDSETITVATIKAQFREFDQNGDGTMNRVELIDVLKLIMESLNEPEVDRVLCDMDRKSNGVIKCSEFVDWLFSPDESSCGASQSGLLKLLPLSPKTFLPPARPKPERPIEPVARVFKLVPLGVEKGAVQDIFEEYIQRVPRRIASGAEKWKTIRSALADGGPMGLELFWIQHADAASPPTASTAEGLAVFRLKKLSTSYGQLLHFTVVDMDHYQHAMDAVRAVMFTYLPVKVIRFTLWYAEDQEEEGKYQLNKEVEAVLKKLGFRWFQLTNSCGVRGQVMQRHRGEPPDDPEKPLEIPCIELCLGQVWLRGGALELSLRGSCAQSLALAGSCLQSFWGKNAAEAPRPESLLDAHSAAAWAVAKEGVAQAFLSGELDGMLSSLKPVKFELIDDLPSRISTKGESNRAAALALSFANSLDASRSALPEIVCQAVADAPTLVSKGLTQESLREACTGLGVEGLPESVAAMQPRDGSFGRLVLTLEWSSISQLDESTFEVPVHVAGTCPTHPHPIFYLATSEAGIFAVIIPWNGMTNIPKSEQVFATCTDILRAMTPMEDLPFSAVRLNSFDARQAVETKEIIDSAALGLPGETLHVSEFSSLSVSSGRVMPGQLRSRKDGCALTIARPFAMCIWHAEMDEINAPLSVTMVA